MKSLLLKLSLCFKGLILLMLSFGTVDEANAQAAPLTVFNTQPCMIYVWGGAYDPACTNRCPSGVVAVPPGGVANIPPCGPAFYYWHVAIFAVGCPPGPGCPPDFSNSPFAVCPPMPPGVPQFCAAVVPVAGAWPNPNTVVF